MVNQSSALEAKNLQSYSATMWQQQKINLYSDNKLAGA